jgi:putative FmdB family regulatory protein
MPIFEYRCEDCGTKFEKLVRGDKPQVACPSCGESHVAQQLSVFATRAGSVKSDAMPGGCAGGMCRTPDLCGRN